MVSSTSSVSPTEAQGRPKSRGIKGYLLVIFRSKNGNAKVAKGQCLVIALRHSYQQNDDWDLDTLRPMTMKNMAGSSLLTTLALLAMALWQHSTLRRSVLPVSFGGVDNDDDNEGPVHPPRPTSRIAVEYALRHHNLDMLLGVYRDYVKKLEELEDEIREDDSESSVRSDKYFFGGRWRRVHGWAAAATPNEGASKELDFRRRSEFLVGLVGTVQGDAFGSLLLRIFGFGNAGLLVSTTARIQRGVVDGIHLVESSD